MDIFLLFDSMIVRNWVADLLSGVPGSRICGECRTPLAALGKIRQTQPDVMIMHAQDQKRFGIDILQSVKNISPRSKVIVLTSRQHDCFGRETINHGADISLNRFADWAKIPGILERFRSETAGHGRSFGADTRCPVLEV